MKNMTIFLKGEIRPSAINSEMSNIRLLKQLKKTFYQRECQKYYINIQNTKMMFLRMQKISDIIINFISMLEFAMTYSLNTGKISFNKVR